MANADKPLTTPRTTRLAELGFGKLFDMIRDAVVVADDRGKIILWNAAAETMFGWTADEAQGQDVAILVPDRMIARHRLGMDRYRRTGHGPLLDGGGILELPALTKSGAEIVVEMRLSSIHEGGRQFAMSILRDVTERAKMEAALEAERRHLREANDSLLAFSYVVGHDLKEPVRAVEAYLDALSEDLERSGAGVSPREKLAKARETNRRMGELLNGLLEWSKASFTGARMIAVDIPTVLEIPACRSRYAHFIHEKNAKVETVGDFPPVLATEGLLCQIFGNLILNALQHNASDAARVVVSAEGIEDKMVVVAIRDNGPGFPPAIRGSDPTSLSGASPSRGFGLRIAGRAVRSLGGRMELGEATGGGAEVRLWLPTPQ